MLGLNIAQLCLILFALAQLSCATLPNVRACAVAGTLSSGMDCAYTLTDKTEELTFEQALDFLEAQPERPDPERPGEMLPARGGAICMSADDWNRMKTELEKACKKLKCKREDVEAIERIDQLRARALKP